MPPYNDFLANVQGGLGMMAPLIAAKHRNEDMAESQRRFDASLGQRQVESDREFGIAQERQKSLSSYHDTLRLESEVRRRAQESEMERIRQQIEEGAEHQARLTEIEKRLAEASRQPGGKHYASVVTDAIYNNPDLLSSQNPAVKARMQALNKTVEARMNIGMMTERMKEEQEAAQMGMDLPSYQRFKRRKELASIGGNPADADALPDGPEGEVAMAAKRYAIESAAKAQAKSHGGRVTVETGVDKDGRPTESVRREFDADDPEAQQFLTKRPDAAPALNTTQSKRLETLRSFLIDLKAAQKRGVKNIDPDNLKTPKPTIDEPWIGKTISVDDAIAQTQGEIDVLSGVGQQPPPAEFSPSITPPPAEHSRTNSVPSAASLPKPASREEFNALPKGARFINPATGEVRIKQ
jgi:hypothetical protein